MNKVELMICGNIYMINIFDYLDYRAYLNDYWKEAKKERPFFSIRFISHRIGINPGYILKVFQGKVHLGVKNIAPFAEILGLKGQEREYFEELVHFGRAKNENEIENRFERLHAIKGIRLRTVADGEAEFYQNWHTMAIRALISIYPFNGKNYREISACLCPPVTVPQARKSIALLERLGMIKKNEQGIFQLTDRFISTGEKWMSPIIKKYQRAILELAIESLEKQDKSLRDISTVTMTFSRNCLPALRERVLKFRQELLSMSEAVTSGDCVMQVNIQVFPAAIINKGEERS